MPRAAQEVVVAAIKTWPGIQRTACLLALCLVTTLAPVTPLQAAVLPADRADILYHAYDGGGAQIDGPSVLVRKEFADTVSVYGNYYVDMVSSASIDVEATASPYSEERTEASVGIDYLNDKTLLSLAFTGSSENDYDAKTVSVGISQDFFGDLTTIGLGFSIGNDTVGNNNDASFQEDTEHRRYNLSLTQVLTRSLIASLVVETVVDEGFLNNPYRSVRYLDPSVGSGYSYEPERYPATRNSDAVALRALYYLPYRAALRGEVRSFSDSWGISASAYELRYTHPLANHWMLEFKYRAYSQDKADFYSDLFAFSEATNFRARDKELSTFASQTFGVGVSYEFKPGFLPYVDKSSINLYWDHIQFDYDDFRDVTSGAAVGEEPLYSFDADVIRLFLSVWY
ncbi:MAG: DUF3570 domain-containing protein [Gammaproteobacteria bacterium]|nr:DUF3570 domain-containing protein [Gammaproteobacteria bacterium]